MVTDTHYTNTELSSSLRRVYLDNVLRNPGPFTAEDFETSEEAITNIERMRVLSVNPVHLTTFSTLISLYQSDVRISNLAGYSSADFMKAVQAVLAVKY